MAPRGSSVRLRLAALAAFADDDLDLAEAALLLAASARPRHTLDDYQVRLDRLADEVGGAARPDADAGGRAWALAEVLVRRLGFRGDERDDDPLAGATLMDLLDSRRGTPEALGVLWLAVAARLGWTAESLSFPAHLLVRFGDEAGGRIIVDPYFGGEAVDAAGMRGMVKAALGLDAELEHGHHAGMTVRAVLVRLENAVKLRALRAGDVPAALEAVRRILLFSPGEAALWREAGMMLVRLEKLDEAVAALEQFVARTANPQARSRTQALLAELKGRMI